MVKKKKAILPPELPPEIDDADVPVSDEDVTYFRENPKYKKLLTNLDTDSINKHVSRVAGFKEDQLEERYEKQNRKRVLKDAEEDQIFVNRTNVLPIKTRDGELQYPTDQKIRSENLHDERESLPDANGSEHVKRLTKAERRQKLKKIRKEAKKQAKEEDIDEVEGSLHSEVLAKVEEDLSTEGQFAKKKLRLAELGNTLIENPEENIKSLKELLDMCDDHDPNIVKLALKSLAAVFRDIIPGYRIRLPTEKELQMKVSKEVRKTRFYESTLLRSYKAYLLKLIALERKPLFHQAAVFCLCNLLEAVPHFNFRENLLRSVVKSMSSADNVIRKLCREAIKSLFSNEGKHNGEATLAAVRLIAEQVKIHDCQLHPDCIEVFLFLTFDEDLKHSETVEEEEYKRKKKRQKYSIEEPKQIQGSDRKKIKKELQAKTREEVSADFKSISFAQDPKERKRMQSETLAAVFETYFRVLKHNMDPSSSRSKAHSTFVSAVSEAHPLLAPCLAGLGKFSHLIDLDFMGDLMSCLKKLSGFGDYENSSSQNCLTITERLQCCIVAFRVMRNNLDALNVDLHDFFVQLYNLLLEYRPDRDKGEVLAEALQTMLWEGKQHDMQRAAAFIKRLATFSLCFGSAETMAALVTLKHLLQKNSKCRNLLENDAGGGSLTGLGLKYQPDATNPNLSGALASVLWELSLLSKHYNPTIASMASSISSMNLSQNQVYPSTSSPLQAFAESSMEKELAKLETGKLAGLDRKKREKGREFMIITPDKCENINDSLNANEAKMKLEDHFSVVGGVMENERLRRELNYVSASISLYDEYKRQKKEKNSSKTKKGKRNRKVV